MRIISGKYRGKKLKEFDITSTKPTLDRVKESMFNLIQFDIVDSVVCDLFSGTGALGIECISRGARFTYLVDTNPKAINLIKENLKSIDGQYQVVNDDFKSFLNKTNIKFDIILLDPPFASDYGIRAIKYILNNDRLNPNGIILFETSVDNNIVLEFNGIDVMRKKYGTVAVYKIQRID